MRKYLIGFLSVLLLVASVMGASAKRPKSPRPGRDAGPAMWV